MHHRIYKVCKSALSLPNSVGVWMCVPVRALVCEVSLLKLKVPVRPCARAY